MNVYYTITSPGVNYVRYGGVTLTLSFILYLGLFIEYQYRLKYWTDNAHSLKVGDIVRHDLKSLSFYFPVCPSVCVSVYSRTKRNTFGHTKLTIHIHRLNFGMVLWEKTIGKNYIEMFLLSSEIST